MTDSSRVENRAHQRFTSKAIVQIIADEDTSAVMGTINNISAGGVSLNLEVDNIKRGYKVGCTVTFEMPVRMFGIDSEDKLTLKAEIKRATNLGKTISCQFQNLKDSEIAVLNKGLRILEVVNKISTKKTQQN
ncbi:PilZ domain-containing protein [Fluviispira vulneris]|uniref:PilZ domain-containing protein n=1 Tax=Fluviispira vulneris TaxID=2763012 RepID=UPI0016491227|nr:PilZ domain-containing protein [Fluviispira vulneris]